MITPNSASRLTSNYPNGFRTLAYKRCHTSKSANPASDIGLQFVRGITVFRKSSYPYFPSKPDDLSRSTHLHKPRRIARRRCGAQFPQQPWKIVPTPPQIYHTARIPLISVTSVISVISVTLQTPHKRLHILTTKPRARSGTEKVLPTYRSRSDFCDYPVHTISITLPLPYIQCRSNGYEVTVSNRRQCRRQSFPSALCI
jgi:hypothetical protein